MTTALVERPLVGELVTGDVEVLVLANPFASTKRVFRHPAGATLAEIVAAAEVRRRFPLRVWLGSELWHPSDWPRVRPKAGTRVTIKAVAHGGGGGGGEKNIAVMVVMIVVIIVAIAVTYGAAAPLLGAAFAAGTFGAAALGAGILIAGGLAVQFLMVSPPRPGKLGDLSGIGGGGKTSPTLSITGTSNRLAPYAPIPKIYGRHRIFPLLGALPYTEIVGDDQYLRQLFIVGYGPLALEDFRIGETLIDDFQDVEIEVRQGFPDDPPLALYANQVIEDEVGAVLTAAASWVQRTSEANADELSVDLACPRGLVLVTAGGARTNQSVIVDVQYRPVGSGEEAWQSVEGPVTVTAASTNLVRRGLRWPVTGGQYDVRSRRLSADSTSIQIADLVVWSVLRTIRHTTPISLAGCATVALRIRANDQLNGVIQSFNCIATSILPDWDAGGGVWVERATRNPAAIYRDLLQGPANGAPVADGRIELEALEAWHEGNTAAARSFDAVLDYESTVYQVLHDVAAAGRAAFQMRDGRYSIVRDLPQVTAVQHFTPRNSWGFRGTKAFPDYPHALKVRFVNPDADWQQDEVVVYADGFDETTASRFEVLELFGCTDADRAWRDGRYFLAVARLRPEVFELFCDIENLVCERGDLVRVAHDIPLWGLAWGRLRAVTTDGGGAVVAVEVDEPVTMEAGKEYSIRLRLTTGVSILRGVVTAPGAQTALALTSSVAAPDVPAAQDVFLFGELGSESVELLVKSIEPGPDLTARLTLIHAAPAVHEADGGTIPPFDSQITKPPQFRPPPAPVITALLSEGHPAVRLPGGTLGSVLTVAWQFAGAFGLVDATVQARYRPTGAAVPWQAVPPVAAEARQLTLGPLEPNQEYDLRLRTANPLQITAGWVTISRILIPSPPVLTYYALTPVPGGLVATIDHQPPRLGPPRVSGLRLANAIGADPHGTIFAGRDAAFTWNAMTAAIPTGDGEDDLTQGLDIRDYVVEVWTGGVRRRWPIAVTTPGYTYTWEANVEDHGLAGVQRAIEIRLWARTHDERISVAPAILAVSNPGPDMSAITPVLTPVFGALVASWQAFTPTDHDFDHYEVLLGTASPPTAVFDRRAKDQGSVIIPHLDADTAYFVRVVPHDAFGAGTASQIATATPNGITGADLGDASIGPNHLQTDVAIITVAAQIANAIIGNAHIADLSADKITAGTLSALVGIGAGHILIDAANDVIHVDDDQTTPETRVLLGKLGAGPGDFGLKIFNVDGQVMFDASNGGVTTAGIVAESVVTTRISNLAVGRVARRTAAGGPTSSTSELVVATLDDVVFLNRVTDVILTWANISVTVATDGLSAITGTIRLRRGSIAGPIVYQVAVTRSSGKSSGSATAGPHSFQIEAPATTGVVDYVLTLQMSDPGIGSGTVAGSIAALFMAKSA